MWKVPGRWYEPQINMVLSLCGFPSVVYKVEPGGGQTKTCRASPCMAEQVTAELSGAKPARLDTVHPFQTKILYEKLVFYSSFEFCFGL